MQITRCTKAIGAGLVLFMTSLALAGDTNTGLWVGDVVVQRINRPGPDSAAWDTTTNLPAANPFGFRVIIHVDATNQARLVQRVLLTYRRDGTLATNAITGQVMTNGTYALLSDESLVPEVKKLDPEAEVTRISSVNFPVVAPVALTGQLGIGGTLSGTVMIPYDDPSNPFVHAFAPQHDNFKVQNGAKIKLPAGVESFDITRNLTFQFAAQDPSNPTNPKWGIDENGGDFSETIYGLYRPIQVQGWFRLQRLTTIGQLAEIQPVEMN